MFCIVAGVCAKHTFSCESSSYATGPRPNNNNNNDNNNDDNDDNQYICIYIYIHVHVIHTSICICMCIYIYNACRVTVEAADRAACRARTKVVLVKVVS